jgi:hypothetical protein
MGGDYTSAAGDGRGEVLWNGLSRPSVAVAVATNCGFLLPSREKVAAEGRRMRGRAGV